MKQLKIQQFYDETRYLVRMMKFVNENGIQKDDIVKIFVENGVLVLLYYAEE